MYPLAQELELRKFFQKNLPSAYYRKFEFKSLKLLKYLHAVVGAGIKNNDGNAEGYSSNPGDFFTYLLLLLLFSKKFLKNIVILVTGILKLVYL